MAVGRIKQPFYLQPLVYQVWHVAFVLIVRYPERLSVTQGSEELVEG